MKQFFEQLTTPEVMAEVIALVMVALLATALAHYIKRWLRPVAARSDIGRWPRHMVIVGMVLAPSFMALVLIVGLRALFASRPFALLLLCLFGGLFVAYGVFTWIPPYLDESAGFSTAQISLVSALMTLVGIPATFGFGWLADRGARPLVLAAVGLALPVLLVAFALTSTPSPGLAAIVAAAAAFGISGGLAPLYALPPVLFGAAGGATASGIAASSAMAGAVTSTYLGGWIVGATDGYDVAFWIYAVAAAAAGFVLVPLVAASLGRVRSVTAPER